MLALPAAGESFALGLPDEFRLRNATLFIGALHLDGPEWLDPVFLDAREAELAEGTLVVCAKTSAGVLAATRPASESGCPDPTSHAAPWLTFGRGTDLHFYGPHRVIQLPAATLSLFTGDDRHAAAHLFSNQPMRLAGEGAFSFEPVSAESAIYVDDPAGPVWYNGTEWRFTFDGAELAILAAGGAGWYAGDLRVHLQPAERSDVRTVLDPFRLLDLQERLLGPDGREPRANVTGLLTEYGRVSDYVNGAIVGRLNGTIGARQHFGDVSLVRVESMEGVLSGPLLEGRLEPVVEVTPSGIAIEGGTLHKAPWGLVAAAWMAAIAASMVRRHPSVRTRGQLALRVGAPVAGFILVDLGVMGRAFGTSALAGGWRRDFETPDLLALVTFELVTLAVAVLVVLLPLRVLTVRVVRTRVTAAEAILVAFWLASLMVLPGAYFALGHDLARL